MGVQKVTKNFSPTLDRNVGLGSYIYNGWIVEGKPSRRERFMGVEGCISHAHARRRRRPSGRLGSARHGTVSGSAWLGLAKNPKRIFCHLTK